MIADIVVNTHPDLQLPHEPHRITVIILSSGRAVRQTADVSIGVEPVRAQALRHGQDGWSELRSAMVEPQSLTDPHPDDHQHPD